VAVGFVELRRSPAPIAWLSVSVEGLAYRAQLAAGGRIPLAGGGVLEVVSLTEGEVRLRQARPSTAPVEQAIVAPVGAGTQTLPAMGVYAFPDGRVLGVGNVRLVGGPGEAPAPAVTLHLYPAAYARDPTVGYDLFEDVRLGQKVRGERGTVELYGLESTRGEARGSVTVYLR
jgi:hypothetical protein